MNRTNTADKTTPILLHRPEIFGIGRIRIHLLGISLGFMMLVASVGLGLGQLFEQFPALYTALRYGGAAYLLTIELRLAHPWAHPPQPWLGGRPPADAG